MTKAGLRTVHICIEGRVQGVWFRAWTERTARRLGIKGWVRNRRDGSVEALFSGPAEIVENMLRQCAGGPPSARVDHIEIRDEGSEAPEGFMMRPTE